MVVKCSCAGGELDGSDSSPLFGINEPLYFLSFSEKTIRVGTARFCKSLSSATFYRVQFIKWALINKRVSNMNCRSWDLPYCINALFLGINCIGPLGRPIHTTCGKNTALGWTWQISRKEPKCSSFSPICRGDRNGFSGTPKDRRMLWKQFNFA